SRILEKYCTNKQYSTIVSPDHRGRGKTQRCREIVSGRREVFHSLSVHIHSPPQAKDIPVPASGTAEEHLTMQHIVMTIVLLSLLGGCAQPQMEQPKANGRYLVIENGQAWAVLVSNGRRVEEQGTVVQAIKLPS